MDSQPEPPAGGNHLGDVVVYADYVCPFCYLGYESLDRYRAGRADRGESPLAVEWHPFDLRGQQRRSDGTLDDSIETGKDEAYFEQARENVERLAERYDVDLAQTLATEVDSYTAQRVAWAARETHPDGFERFHRAVFDALWSERRDVGDRVVLDELATEAGLPEGFVASTLAEPDTATSLRMAFEDARRRGITGVPTFLAGDHTARGAVPPEHLRRLVEGT